MILILIYFSQLTFFPLHIETIKVSYSECEVVQFYEIITSEQGVKVLTNSDEVQEATFILKPVRIDEGIYKVEISRKAPNLYQINQARDIKLLGEGGGICISRQISNSGTKFIYHHNEYDPTKEGLDVNKKDEYNNFEHPFQLINDRYPWYLLHLKTIHDDYKNFIIERLIEKLNHKSALLENFEYHKSDLEDILKIKLNNSITKHTNELTWSYEKKVVN